MSYTPGPWTYQVHNIPNLVLTIRTKVQNYYVAEVGRIDAATSEEYIDNAKLIAAAPELLEACKELIDLVEYLVQFPLPQSIVLDMTSEKAVKEAETFAVVVVAKAAISKAE